ncbi:hypothetical protein [Niabella aquatica]
MQTLKSFCTQRLKHFYYTGKKKKSADLFRKIQVTYGVPDAIRDVIIIYFWHSEQ